MKKIYLLSAGLIFCGSLISQTNNPCLQNPVKHKAKLSPNSRSLNRNSSSIDRSAPFTQWVEVVGDVMTNKGIILDGADPAQDHFLTIINCDSTVRVSDATQTSNVFEIMLGSVLDPKSTYLTGTGEPLVEATEQYYIDSIAIQGSYVKVTSTTDTLYTWIVWGDTTGSSPLLKRNTNAVWVDPLATWRSRVIGAKVTGAVAAEGNKVRASAPASNMILVKYVLTDADSVGSGGFSKIIMIPLPMEQITIPAGNIVTCFYTFVPGVTPPLDAIAYSFPGGEAQTVNGFSGIIWGQTGNPDLVDYRDDQVDPSSWCMGSSYQRIQRYGGYLNNSVSGDVASGAVVFYNISNVYTGIQENENNFSLTQNQPNPFSETTMINYQLSKSASRTNLAIYDVRGVKVYENEESNQKQGSYSVNVTTKFTPGVYFYTLTVDGARVTKKMIAQ